MSSRLFASGVALVLSTGLLLQIAAAGPQEDVAAAGQKWATVFADNNPDTITPSTPCGLCLTATLLPMAASSLR